MKLVRVVWHDSISNHGWASEPEFYQFANEGIEEIDTFGLLIHVTETFIVMASSFGAAIGDAIKIPISVIQRIEVLNDFDVHIEGFEEVKDIPKLHIEAAK